MKEYRFVTINDIDELFPYQSDWEALVHSLKLPLSYSPNWLFSWLKSYADGNIEIDVTFIYYEKILFAVLPLMIRTEEKKRTLKFLSDSCSDYLGIPFNNAILPDLSSIITQRFKSLEFTHYNFNNIHENDFTLLVITSALANCGLKTEIRVIGKSLSMKFDETYNEAFNSIFSHRQFKRKERNINKNGNITFSVIHTPDKMLWDEIFLLHIKKWSENNVFPQFLDARRREFVTKISNLYCAEDKFTVFCLYLNQKLIAYRIGVIYNNIYYDWNTSFDTKVEKYAPGIVLLTKVIIFLKKEKIQEFDFMNGNEKYKYTWANKVKNIFTISGINVSKNMTPLVSLDTPKLKSIKSKRCLILDFHGIIFKGGKPINSTLIGINKLQLMGIKIGVLTNTSALSVSSFQEIFREVGLKIPDDFIMTSAIAIKNFLIEKQLMNCYLIGGEPELPALLKKHKIKLTKIPSKAEAVVVAFTKDFKYSHLMGAYEAIENGAEFICSDADLLYASDNRNLPGVGWIVSSISSVCNKEPLIIGKPNDYALRSLMKIMAGTTANTMFVGDSLESDIKSGKKAGITTCLHLGGVSHMDEVKLLPSALRPDFIIDSFDEIVEIFISN